MTQREKQIVFDALSEYALAHQKKADKAALRNRYSETVEEHENANTALCLLTFWRKNVLDVSKDSISLIV